MFYLRTLLGSILISLFWRVSSSHLFIHPFIILPTSSMAFHFYSFFLFTRFFSFWCLFTIIFIPASFFFSIGSHFIFFLPFVASLSHLLSLPFISVLYRFLFLLSITDSFLFYPLPLMLGLFPLSVSSRPLSLLLLHPALNSLPVPFAFFTFSSCSFSFYFFSLSLSALPVPIFLPFLSRSLFLLLFHPLPVCSSSLLISSLFPCLPFPFTTWFVCLYP